MTARKSPISARFMVAGSLAIAAALTLSSCSSNNDGATPPESAATSTPAATTPQVIPDVDSMANDAILVDAISVTGPAGQEPTVEFEPGLVVSFLTPRLVSDGTGAALQEGQFVTVNASMWRTDTGEKMVSTWEDGFPEYFVMGGNDFAVLAGILEGAHVGARVLIVNPSTLRTGENATLVTLFEIEAAQDIYQHATGTPVEYDAAALGVAVERDEAGEPAVEISGDLAPSDELIVQTLIEGTGPVVSPEQTLVVHYTGWLTDGTVFDSSWMREEPAMFPLQAVIPGWAQGLTGQHVGSQVLLIIPPEYGYGNQQTGMIPPNSTLIFVVDILHAEG